MNAQVTRASANHAPYVDLGDEDFLDLEDFTARIADDPYFFWLERDGDAGLGNWLVDDDH